MRGWAVCVASAALVFQSQQPISAACDGEDCLLRGSRTLRATVPVIPYGSTPSEHQKLQMRILQQQHALQHQAFLQHLKLQESSKASETQPEELAPVKETLEKDSFSEVLNGHQSVEQGEGQLPTLSLQEYQQLLGKTFAVSKSGGVATNTTTPSTTTTTTTTTTLPVETTTRKLGFTQSSTTTTTTTNTTTTRPTTTSKSSSSLTSKISFPAEESSSSPPRKGLLHVPSLATLLGISTTTTTTTTHPPADISQDSTPSSSENASSSSSSTSQTTTTTAALRPSQRHEKQFAVSSDETSSSGRGFLASLFVAKPAQPGETASLEIAGDGESSLEEGKPATVEELLDSEDSGKAPREEEEPIGVSVENAAPSLPNSPPSPIFNLQRLLGFTALPRQILSAGLEALRREPRNASSKTSESNDEKADPEAIVAEQEELRLPEEGLPTLQETEEEEKSATEVQEQGHDVKAQEKLQEAETVQDEVKEQTEKQLLDDVQGEDQEEQEGGEELKQENEAKEQLKDEGQYEVQDEEVQDEVLDEKRVQDEAADEVQDGAENMPGSVEEDDMEGHHAGVVKTDNVGDDVGLYDVQLTTAQEQPEQPPSVQIETTAQEASD